jgi:hypothetical protein
VQRGLRGPAVRGNSNCVEVADLPGALIGVRELAAVTVMSLEYLVVGWREP